MIPQPALRISFIILSITLTVILISSPVIAVFPYSLLLSPIALRVEFASATSSENNDDNEEEQPNTDATTDGEEEVDGDSGDDVQEEQQEVQDGEEEEEQQEQQQLATVVGEICDDFEDNDGDGLIDLADADCAAAPLTQGSVTAPTTPSPSVTNTTATNSTNNTLTASEITTREMTTPPSTDDEASGITTGNTVTVDGRPVIDLEKECQSYEELGIPPPPLGFGQPPDAKWYHCPPGVGVWVAPNGTTSLGTGGEGGQQQQQQQQPNSPSSCPPKPTNYYDAPARIIHVQLPPPLSSPSSPPPPQTTTNPCPPGQSSATSPQQPGVEICDDFEDNDGDGLIDLEDVKDCGAPLTRGTVTAPTTPSQPPPSVINTTATNNTGNTLTASGTTSPDSGQQQPPPPPPPAGAPVTQSTTTTTTTTTDSDKGREGLEICYDSEDNDGDSFVDYLDNDCAAPATQGTVTTQGTETDPANLPTGKSEDESGNIWTHYPDGRKETTGIMNGRYFGTTTEYPDGTTKNYVPRSGLTLTYYPEGVSVAEDSAGNMGVQIGGDKNCGRYATDFDRQYKCLQVLLYQNGTAFVMDPISKKPVRPLTPDAAAPIYSLLLVLEVQHPT